MAMTSDALIADLMATFPGIHARPLRDYNCPDPVFQDDGVWMGGEAAMPDGRPVFSTLIDPDQVTHDGHVHAGFVAWVESRGFTVETWDYGVYFAVPVNRSLI